MILRIAKTLAEILLAAMMIAFGYLLIKIALVAGELAGAL